MASPQLDALLADDLHDAFRLMYDGVDTTFALDAAYAEVRADGGGANQRDPCKGLTREARRRTRRYRLITSRPI